jgi:hypothetical protein
MWVQLRAQKQIAVAGKSRVFYPGDWVDIGRQTAMQWIATGEAYVPRYSGTEIVGRDSGIVVRYGAPAARPQVERLLELVGFVEGPPAIHFERNLLWDPGLNLREGLVPIGFNLLQTWEVAVPLWSYKELACQVGSDEERARTLRVVRDLRVPLYDTRMVFVRRCPAGLDLLTAWREEWTQGADEKQAFLRGLYRVKPLILALPITWTQGQGAA